MLRRVVVVRRLIDNDITNRVGGRGGIWGVDGGFPARQCERMKSILTAVALVVSAFSCFGQGIGASAAVRGEYAGILVPTRSCANERLAIEMTVTSDGYLLGSVYNWEGQTNLAFNCAWPFFDGKRFTSDITGLNDVVKGTFNAKQGTVRGTVKFEFGCAYTFVMYRRYKVQP